MRWLLVLIVFMGYSVPGNAQMGLSAQSYFQEDPYLPFINYDNDQEELSSFQEYYGADEKPIRDQSVEKQLNEMIAMVYEGYKKAFPRFMQNKVMPHALLHEGDYAFDANAFVNRRTDLHQGIMFVGRGFIASSVSSDVKIGILAHEFAHLFFGDKGRSGYAFNIHYASGRPMTKKETSAFESWLELSQKLGLLLLPESNGITKDSDLARYIDPVVNEMVASKNPYCGQQLLEKLSQKMIAMMSLYSPINWNFVVDTPEKKKLLSDSTLEMEHLVEACTKEETLSPIPIPAGVVRIFLKYNVASDLPWASGLTFEQLFRAAREGKEKLRDLATQFELADIRYNSFEDRADQAAVIVLKSLKRNPTEFAESFLFAMYNDKGRCLEEIKSGVTPPYGNPVDVHHSVCYRIDQLKKFVENNSRIPLE